MELERALRWQLCVGRLAQLQDQRLQPEAASAQAFHQLCRQGSWHRATQCAFLQPNIMTYSGKVSACVRTSRWKQALHFLLEPQLQNIETDTIIHNAVLTALEKGSRWRLAMVSRLELGRRQLADLITCNALLSACEAKALWQTAIVLMVELWDAGLQADVISYNTTISSHGRSEQWQEALRLCSEVSWQSLERQVVTWSSSISACEKSSQWEQAVALLDELNAQRCRSDVIAYSAVISACEKAYQWQAALQLLRDCIDKVGSDVIVYSAAISACEKSEQWQHALLLFWNLKDELLATDVILYNAAISACESRGKWQQALLLLEDMAESCLRGSTTTLNVAISSCQKGGKWQQAVALANEVASCMQTDIVTFSAAITACEDASEWEQAALFLAELQNSTLQCDVVALQDSCVLHKIDLSLLPSSMNEWLRIADLFAGHNFLFAVKACLSGHCDPCAMGGITCVFKSWEPWSSCSQACEGGVEERKRGVTEGVASSHGGGCDGALVTVRSCNTHRCGQSCLPVDCKWGKWSEWSACSKCAGQKTRHRRVVRVPECGGRRCKEGDVEEIAKCPRNCHGEPICMWSDWSVFSKCTVSCGLGRKKRSRRLQVVHTTPQLEAAYESLERLDGHVQKLESKRLKIRFLAFVAGPSAMLMVFAAMRVWSRSAREDAAERASVLEMSASLVENAEQDTSFDAL
ncbi:unnamed protein product [Symbiodinium sp. KB8]|nr:unnamed protein product [Symbiodinium sp. KB8]